MNNTGSQPTPRLVPATSKARRATSASSFPYLRLVASPPPRPRALHARGARLQVCPAEEPESIVVPWPLHNDHGRVNPDGCHGPDSRSADPRAGSHGGYDRAGSYGVEGGPLDQESALGGDSGDETGTGSGGERLGTEENLALVHFAVKCYNICSALKSQPSPRHRSIARLTSPFSLASFVHQSLTPSSTNRPAFGPPAAAAWHASLDAAAQHVEPKQSRRRALPAHHTHHWAYA